MLKILSSDAAEFSESTGWEVTKQHVVLLENPERRTSIQVTNPAFKATAKTAPEYLLLCLSLSKMTALCALLKARMEHSME
jgi:hypothetical protein